MHIMQAQSSHKSKFSVEMKYNNVNERLWGMLCHVLIRSLKIVSKLLKISKFGSSKVHQVWTNFCLHSKSNFNFKWGKNEFQNKVANLSWNYTVQSSKKIIVISMYLTSRQVLYQNRLNSRDLQLYSFEFHQNLTLKVWKFFNVSHNFTRTIH